MSSLAAIPTGLGSTLPVFDGISTVIFDVYGTLLISAAGDIGMTGSDEPGQLAMSEVCGFLEGSVEGAESKMAGELITLLEDALAQKRGEGVEFPEVDIRLIWKELLARNAPAQADSRIDEAALMYECQLNPVWEMPGALDLIEALKKKGVAMGVISNAQNYTHSVFAGVMGASFESLGFDPDLMVFSYLEGEGKPALTLYQKMKTLLSDRGVSLESVLYVGNDMIKDVIPAAKIGFRTCLFAGDKRSLRLGDLSGDDAGSLADAVVTDMSQILKLLK